MATYTIKSGDTLSKIAAQYGTTVAALSQANGISNPNAIRAGAQLTIPGSGNSQSQGTALTPGQFGGSVMPKLASTPTAPAVAPASPTAPTATPSGTPAGKMQPVTLGNGATVYVDNTGAFFDSTGKPVDPSSVAASTASGPATSSGSITTTSTGDPQLDQILQGIAGLGNKIISSGYTIPSTLQITPDIVGQFLSFAHQNVDPYYQQLLSGRIADVNSNLANLATQYNTSRDQAVQDFGTGLATEQNAAGASGTAFSGQRALNENNMAATTNRTLSSLGSTAAYNVGSALRSGAADVGAANAGQFQLPTLAGGQVSLAGGQRGSFTPGQTLDFGYNPSIYTVGNIPSAQGQAASQLQQTYLGQYGTLAGAQSNSGRSVSDLFGMMGLS